MSTIKRTRRNYRKALTRVRLTAREVIRWHNRHANDDEVGLLDEIDKLRLGLELVLKMATRGLEGLPFGQPACIICEKAEPTLYKRFCQPCFETIKAKFRRTWKDVTFESEQDFEGLVLSFYVSEQGLEGDEQDG